ncbi:MAG: acyl-CoA desaturase [Gemmatimonadaceae bacterium]
MNSRFHEMGFHKKLTGRILFEGVFMITLMCGGIVIFFEYHSLWVKAFALWFSSIGLLAITTNTHTSAHYATSDKRWVNWALQLIGYSFFIGLSATYWRHKHVVVHHPTPNVVGLDDDIDLLPFFALDECAVQASTGFRRWWFDHQWLLVPIIINLNALSLLNSSYKFLWRALRNPEERKPLHLIDLSLVLLHYAVFMFLPMLWFPPLYCIAFWVVRYFCAGWAIFIVFAPAHFPAEALFLSKGNKQRAEYLRNRDFVLLQCATTCNIKTTWFGNLFCGGTDYQIEHHLFPGISHPHYPKMAPYVKAWCEEHGYPYRTVTFVEGFWKSWMSFRYPKPVRETEEVARLMVEEAQRDFIEQEHLAAAKLLGGNPARALADYTL